jgi:hypothetical protein
MVSFDPAPDPWRSTEKNYQQMRLPLNKQEKCPLRPENAEMNSWSQVISVVHPFLLMAGYFQFEH